ncbi:patched family protein [Flammeovirgaceae bacterium 311]|nr:patched family protein [Flammeovirgaceae bacterium 311]
MISGLYRYRYFLLGALLLACVLLWPGIKRAVQVDNSLKAWFLEDDPALLAYQDFKSRFGNDEVVILLVKEEQGLLTPDYFSAFTALTKALQALPEVEEVLGPGNAQVGARGFFGASPGPLLRPDVSPQEVKKKLEENPLLKEQLFTPDYKAARFLVVLKALPDFDDRRGAILEKVQATVASHLPQKNTHFGGIGVIFAGLNTLSQQDFGFFLALGYGAMFLLILYIYRSVRVLVYALATVGIATWLTLGLYGSLGYRLNLMTTLIPSIIVLLGILDVIHVVNERNLQAAESTDKKEVALRALEKMWKPCLFTTLTTMAGFLALLISPMAILKGFGIFAALGIFLSLLCTYLLGLVILPLASPAQQVSTYTQEVLSGLHRAVLARKGVFGALSAIMVLVCLLGIGRLKTDTYTLGYFPEAHRVVHDHAVIEKSWGNYLPLELMVQPRGSLQLHSPELVQAALAFADSAKTLAGIGRVFGFASLYKAGLESQYGEKSKQLLRYKSGLLQADKQLRTHFPVLVRHYLHDASNTGRITVSGRMVSASELNAKMDTLMSIAQATLGKVATVKAGGYQPMYAGIVNYATQSQVYSLLLALLLVFGLVWLFIRRLRLALLSVVPNIFPIVLMLGAMGWLGITLDVATASIAAIVLSFCIDDTLHFIHRYQQLRKAGKNGIAAQSGTIDYVGAAMVLTSLILFFGYSLMIFASLKTVMLFGSLTALAIAGSLYSYLVILPLLLSRFDRDKDPKAALQTYVTPPLHEAGR